MGYNWDVSYIEDLEGSQFAHVFVDICYRLRNKIDNLILAHESNPLEDLLAQNYFDKHYFVFLYTMLFFTSLFVIVYLV